MRALSIKQPWAWLIVAGFKDIENRPWHTKIRERILIHAGKTFDKPAMEWMKRQAEAAELPRDRWWFLRRGGLIGSVEIVDCVTEHDSEWFFGPHGLVLANPAFVPFYPCLGSQRWFDVPVELTRNGTLRATRKRAK